MYFCLYLNIFRITFFLLYHRRAIVQKPDRAPGPGFPATAFVLEFEFKLLKLQHI